jgi:uncharacterized protein
MYLSTLIGTGFVERHIPITKQASSRLERHHITDPFLRFYYRFLSRRQSQLALGVDNQTLAEIKQHLADFIGTHTWEELCQEWLLRATSQKVLPFLPDQVGSIGNREAQIDVAGINFMEKTLILGECKWDRHPMDLDVPRKLIEKTEKVLPPEGKWRLFYLGCSSNGWTPSVIKFVKSVKGTETRGERWQTAGMLLKTLEEVDADLDTRTG